MDESFPVLKLDNKELGDIYFMVRMDNPTIVSLNWSQAVILVRFADGTGEESVEMEEVNEGEK